jgi:hypothetical protein
MRTSCLVGAAVLLGACGPSMTPEHVNTPDEIVQQQSSLAPGPQQANEGSDEGYVDESDAEHQKQFDERQADLELKRAARSAETCGGVVEGGPRGMAKVTLTFQNDGHVKDSSIAPPFAETEVGKCVLRAMAAVVVPNFIGPEKTMEWTVNVTEPGKKGAGKKE